MTFAVFLDTCVLFPATLRDVLLRVAEQGAFRPHWSKHVLDELELNLICKRNLPSTKVGKLIDTMRDAFEDAEVMGYQPLIPGMTCHPKDAHVLAAAVASDCQVIVTANLKDFPAAALEPYNLEAVHPDEFLLDQLDLHPEAVAAAIQSLLTARTAPPLNLVELCDQLSRSGTPRFAQALRAVEPTSGQT